MAEFWQFARMMLHYRRLLGFALAGAVLDALCVLGGFGTLTWVIQQFFDRGATIRQIVYDRLAGSRLEAYVGDLGWVAGLIPAGQMGGLAFVLGIILVLGLIGSAGRFAHEYNVFTVTLRTVMRIRKRVFTRLVHLPMTAAAGQATGGSISRIVRDTNVLARGFNALTSRAVRGVLIGVALLIGAVYLDWGLSLIFLAVIPPIFVLMRKFGKRVRRASKRAMHQYGLMLGAVTEGLQALRVIKVHHTEGFERRRFNRINRQALAQEMRARTARALASPTVEMMGMAVAMAVVLIAAWSVFEWDRRPDELVSVLVMLVGAAMSFRTMATLNNSLQEAAAAAVRVDDVLRLPVEPAAREERRLDLPRLPRHRESIVFDHVSFTYPGSDEPALRGVDLRVEHGTACAIVGANGSGKSTLIGLLPRLYDPTGGRVLVDGIDIAGTTLRTLRRQIAMVTQETVLFDGTIADNLVYGSRHADPRAMVEAAKAAHIHDFIESLAGGYETPIGERGQRLSGGQRQRMAIARAILRDPSILILDEATSQVDTDSEARISASLEAVMAGRTTFMIAHRLSTVVDADMIVVLDAGAVAAVGKHGELLATSDAYRVLCRTQLGLGVVPSPAPATRP